MTRILALIAAFGIVGLSVSVPAPVAAQEASSKPINSFFFCRSGNRHGGRYAAVETTLSIGEVARQWGEWLREKGYSDLDASCRSRSGSIPDYGWDDTPFTSIASIHKMVADNSAQYGEPLGRVEWTPAVADSPLSSSRQITTVHFRDPEPGRGEKGYSNNTFDIEYQFIACMGELHLAYSVVERSVRSKTPTYFLNGTFYRVSQPDPTVVSLPISGEVWMEPYHNRILGKFADDFASKSLGFGCFTGQTKKIMNVSELTDDTGKPATKDGLPKILDRLRVSFKTTTVATSITAENEIKSGNAQKAADERQRSGQDGLDRAAEERARRAAEREAEFAAKKAKYDQDLAAQQKAVAEYEAAQRQMAADKEAAAVKAKAAQDAFARQQADHQAKLDQHARQQAEYEATLAAQARKN